MRTSLVQYPGIRRLGRWAGALAVCTAAFWTPCLAANSAADRVQVLLAAAGGAPGPGPVQKPSPALAKVLPALRGSLRYRRYRLLETHWITLRNDSTLPLYAGRFRMQTRILPGGSVQLTVKQGKQTLITAGLRFKPGKPIVLGGFPASGNQKLLLILVAPKRPER